MERSRNDLESIVNSQREQLSRYEKRLKGKKLMRHCIYIPK